MGKPRLSGRNGAIWTCFLLSVLFHLASLFFVGFSQLTLDEDERFKTRILQRPKIQPRRFNVGPGRLAPQREMEYTASDTRPGELSEKEMPLAPPRLRPLEVAPPSAVLEELASGAKPDTFELVEEQRPTIAELAQADPSGDRSMDLLRLEDLARANKEQGAVIAGAHSRQDVKGYINFTRLRLYGAGSVDEDGGLNALARYIRDYSGVLAQVREVHYDYFRSSELLKAPIHFFFEGAGLQAYDFQKLTYFDEREYQVLGEYLRGGGFVFVEGSYRYLREMAAHFEQVLGNEGRMVPLSTDHPLYHSFYDFGGGFPGEDKDGSRQGLEGLGDPWYYPAGRADVVEADPGSGDPNQQANPATLPALGLWGVERDGVLVAVFSDLGLREAWATSFSVDSDETQSSLYSLMAATNLVLYALTRDGSVAPRIERPAWEKVKPSMPLAAVDLGGARPEDEELFEDLDAYLAVVRSPLGRPLEKGGVRVSLDGNYGVDVLKGDIHGLLLHNVPAGPHWIEVEFGGKSKQLEVELRGGKVLTVTFGLNRFAFLTQMRVKAQEQLVELPEWLHSFADLLIDEVYLGEDAERFEAPADF